MTQRKGESETTKRLRLALASLERANEVISMTREMVSVLGLLNVSIKRDRGDLPVEPVITVDGPLMKINPIYVRMLADGNSIPVTDLGESFGTFRYQTASGTRYMRSELTEV